MSPVEARAAIPTVERPRRAGKVLFLAMLAALVVSVFVAVIAMHGWDRAIQRADQQTTRAAALQAAVDQAARLQQKVTTLQQALTDAGERERALEAQLAEIKPALAQAKGTAAQAAAAEERAAAAERTALNAERTLVELQGELNAVRAATAERSPPQPANGVSAAMAPSSVAPELPLPGLPRGATARDYLVAAHQAVRQGSVGRAQSALERAEIRMLNEASLTGNSARLASHPGITEVEHALDQLGKGDTEGVLRTINGLLTQR